MERIKVNLLATCACKGSSSQTSSPGTFVRIGLKSPRYSTGASGFMSYVSMCGGPPGNHRKITEVSGVECPASRAAPRRLKSVDRLVPPRAKDPHFRNSRREVGPGQDRPSLFMRSSDDCVC